MLQPYLFQLFQPIGGVKASPLSRVRTDENKAMIDKKTNMVEIVFIIILYLLYKFICTHINMR